MKFHLGDRVLVDGPDESEKCSEGIVVMMAGMVPGEKPTTVEPTELWLDMYPGAMGPGRWVFAHFEHSWCPDRPAWHAVNIFPVEQCRPYDQAEVDRYNAAVQAEMDAIP